MSSPPVRRAGDASPGSTQGVIPERAVLTELARGFLLVHDADPERAKRFAQTFLREAAGSPTPSRPLPPGRLAMARRGVDGALRDGR